MAEVQKVYDAHRLTDQALTLVLFFLDFRNVMSLKGICVFDRQKINVPQQKHEQIFLVLKMTNFQQNFLRVSAPTIVAKTSHCTQGNYTPRNAPHREVSLTAIQTQICRECF